MTILKAGTFKVSAYRRAIPDMTKACVLNQDGKCSCGKLVAPDIRFDHDPSLNQRDHDTGPATSYRRKTTPPYIIATYRCHDVKTFGPERKNAFTRQRPERSRTSRCDQSQTKEFRARLTKPKAKKDKPKSKWPNRPMHSKRKSK